MVRRNVPEDEAVQPSLSSSRAPATGRRPGHGVFSAPKEVRTLVQKHQITLTEMAASAGLNRRKT